MAGENRQKGGKMCVDMGSEDSVVFDDGQGPRRLRGFIIDDPKSEFIIVQRRDSEIRIRRSLILKMELAGRRSQ